MYELAQYLAQRHTLIPKVVFYKGIEQWNHAATICRKVRGISNHPPQRRPSTPSRPYKGRGQRQTNNGMCIHAAVRGRVEYLAERLVHHIRRQPTGHRGA